MERSGGEAAGARSRTAMARRRALPAMLAVGVCAALAGAAVATGVLQLAVLQQIGAGAEVSESLAAVSDGLYGGVGLLQLLATVVAGILWLRWLHAAYGALREVGSGYTTFTPGWAVGYWFVPLVNLVRPYQIVRELWQRSESANALDALPGQTPNLVSGWWGLWLVAALGGRVAASQQMGAATLPDLTSATMVQLVIDAIVLAAGVLAVLIVRRIAQVQSGWSGRAATTGRDLAQDLGGAVEPR
jgi:hypothetical protein